MAQRGGRVWISAYNLGLGALDFLILYAEFGVGFRLLGLGSRFQGFVCEGCGKAQVTGFLSVQGLARHRRRKGQSRSGEGRKARELGPAALVSRAPVLQATFI